MLTLPVPRCHKGSGVQQCCRCVITSSTAHTAPFKPTDMGTPSTTRAPTHGSTRPQKGHNLLSDDKCNRGPRKTTNALPQVRVFGDPGEGAGAGCDQDWCGGGAAGPGQPRHPGGEGPEQIGSKIEK
eukprot:9398074-Pyramimonas_sp.AAC.2